MLMAVLDGLSLQGTVRVSHLRRGSSVDPNQAVRLMIRGQVVDIPPDPHSDLTPFDVGPLGFVTATLWTLDALMPSGARADPWVVGPLAAFEAALVAWSHRQIARRGREAHPRVLAAALVAGALDCVAVTATMGATRSVDGVRFFPASSSVTPTMLMLPLYWRDLSHLERRLVIGALCAIVALGVAIHPDRPSLRHLALELLWPLSALISRDKVGTTHAEVGTIPYNWLYIFGSATVRPLRIAPGRRFARPRNRARVRLFVGSEYATQRVYHELRIIHSTRN